MSLLSIGTRRKRQEAVNFQATKAVSVTPADSDLTLAPAAGIYVGTGGDVEVQMEEGDVVIFSNVADGTFLPIMVNQVRTTDTTASDILALY